MIKKTYQPLMFYLFLLFLSVLRGEFREEPDDTVAVVGEPIILECSPPRGHPPPSVTWEKDGEIVEDDGNRVRIMEDGNLMISEVKFKKA